MDVLDCGVQVGQCSTQLLCRIKTASSRNPVSDLTPSQTVVRKRGVKLEAKQLVSELCCPKVRSAGGGVVVVVVLATEWRGRSNGRLWLSKWEKQAELRRAVDVS
jgi:hypothetical protein